MSSLLNGFSTLRSTEYRDLSNSDGSETLTKWRMSLSADGRYAVHLEQHFGNGGSAEGFLYLGDSLDAANACYSNYTQGISKE
jgi:hypothetical protein